MEQKSLRQELIDNYGYSNELGFPSIKEALGFFMGIVENSLKMDNILDHEELNYIGRTDTGTIWQYQNDAWVDTLISFDLQGLQAAEDGAQSGNIITINDDGNATIESSTEVVSVLLGTGDTGWQMEGASSYK